MHVEDKSLISDTSHVVFRVFKEGVGSITQNENTHHSMCLHTNEDIIGKKKICPVYTLNVNGMNSKLNDNQNNLTLLRA